ncbi:glycoside hydrolase family 28 protein [Aliifodinibius sp. S!AR15-10]|uniref:glycoside hydrolase family 28 protein n=1 Tax=Aliifodinibius sp. S!AR15-10 TaxID=2950437 RepID=UPI0028570E55|nr:glycoside hydrolase family 28 protein [Aliifodinibius sp. S!AR15-10]MDR8393337.1 glycoside hydrolase family 28 protein [Aliifodinibius sp. S!AR15-10]
MPDSFYEGISFDMPKVPVPEFPDYSVNIEEFGAVPDGNTLNTEAFRKAIAHVAEQGGGRVVIPQGIWKTGPITLQSNINLHAEKGALVIFSGDKELYPLVDTSFEGLDTWRVMSPIYGKGLTNVAITGEGIFDGSGHTWRGVNKSDMNEYQWEEQVVSGGVLSEDGETWYPSEEYRLSHQKFDSNVPADLETREDHQPYKDFLRPVMVSIRESKNVLFDGPTFQNSPAWMLHPLMSENVIIRNLTVRNPEYSWNGDGVDLESSKNAVIYNNSFDVGDDAICIKSGKNEDGRRRGIPTENVIIRENTVYKAHGGFVVGSEMSGGVRNIAVSDMNFIGTDTGIRFKSTRGRGGVVENIDIHNIYMQDIVTEPLRFNLYYGGEAPSPDQNAEVVDKEAIRKQLPEVTEETPQFRNIRIRNIYSYDSETALWIQGLPEMNVQNVSIENVEFTSDRGGMIMDADQISMKNVDVRVSHGPILYLNNVHNLGLEEVTLGYEESADAGTGLRIVGPFTEALDLSGISFTNTSENLSVGPNVEETEIVK